MSRTLHPKKENVQPIRKYHTTSSHTICLLDNICFNVPLLNLFSGSVDPRALFESSSYICSLLCDLASSHRNLAYSSFYESILIIINNYQKNNYWL